MRMPRVLLNSKYVNMKITCKSCSYIIEAQNKNIQNEMQRSMTKLRSKTKIFILLLESLQIISGHKDKGYAI